MRNIHHAYWVWNISLLITHKCNDCVIFLVPFIISLMRMNNITPFKLQIKYIYLNKPEEIHYLKHIHSKLNKLSIFTKHSTKEYSNTKIISINESLKYSFWKGLHTSSKCDTLFVFSYNLDTFIIILHDNFSRGQNITTSLVNRNLHGASYLFS